MEKETIMHGKVRVSLHACTNNYLRCKKCEVHDLVCKHVIGCTEKYVPRFLTLEALVIWENVNIFLLDVKSITQHDGGAGCILSEKNLSQNKGQVVHFISLEQFIAKIAKTGPCQQLKVAPSNTPKCSRYYDLICIKPPKK